MKKTAALILTLILVFSVFPLGIIVSGERMYDVNDDFEDNVVMVTLKKEYSNAAVEVTKDYFPELDIDHITNYIISDPDSSNFTRDLAIFLNTHSKEAVVDACELLSQREDVKVAHPSWIFQIIWDDPVPEHEHVKSEGTVVMDRGVEVFVCTICGEIMEEVPVFGPVRGDVDGDGVVNMKDISVLKAYIAGTVAQSEIDYYNTIVIEDDFSISIKSISSLKVLIAG
ncbi:MAG: hypothetical protein IKN38_03400 [Clostridia bacterium]|nr:hypothetical protein [Clostridia bacterium]